MSESSRVSLPQFVFVSGKPGSGKPTLARRLADALWFPLLSKDAIKQGLLETRAAAEDEAARVVDGPTSFGVFYGSIGFLLRAGVSLVAEASFQRGLDEPKFQPLMEVARIVNVHCETSIPEAQRRFVAREGTERQRFFEALCRNRPDNHPRYDPNYFIDQMERGTFDWMVFDPLDLDVPRLHVDTTTDYVPNLDRIVTFIRRAARARTERDP